MSYFVVTYDLVKNRNYERMENGIHIVSAGRCQRILDSVWIIKTSHSKASEVRDFLVGYMDSDDKLFVIGVGESVKPWASTRVDKGTIDWLKSRH